MEPSALYWSPHPTPPIKGRKEPLAPMDLIGLAHDMAPALQKAIFEFWHLSPEIRLFSLSSTPHYYWQMQDFYVAQKGLDPEGRRWAQLRLSEGLCEKLFETTLGASRSKDAFTLGQIRNFEVFLLERFSRKLFQALSPKLLKKAAQPAPLDGSDPVMHMVWVLAGSNEDQYCQIVFTAPQSCLKSDGVCFTAPNTWEIRQSAYLHAHSAVCLQVGKSRARLDDLKALELGDILLLESSQIDQWHVRDRLSGKLTAIPIHVPDEKIGPALLDDTTQGSTTMSTPPSTHKPNIWDNLEVDVTAAFNPLKMPLKRLKEIEEGLVLEVGDLMEHRIQIEVEGNAVAWGELLVLGDKFGVRIQGVYDDVQGKDPEPTVGYVASSTQSPSDAPPSTPQRETSEEWQDPSPQAAAPPPQEAYDGIELDSSDFDGLDDEDNW